MKKHNKSVDLLEQLGRAKAEVRRIEGLIDALVANENDDPNLLLDAVIKVLKLKDDKELSQALDVHALVFTKIRHKEMGIPVPMMKRMQVLTGLHSQELKSLMTATPN